MTSPLDTLPFEPYKIVPPAMIFVFFGNTFCLFLHPAEIPGGHKIMDILPAPSSFLGALNQCV
jgi:hypothetical protein